MPILIFVMSSYIEEKQPSQSMAMHGKRGKPLTEDEFSVLGDMKGTPRYWRKVMNETFAKLTTGI